MGVWLGKVWFIRVKKVGVIEGYELRDVFKFLGVVVKIVF